jgi:hypothetical protein
MDSAMHCDPEVRVVESSLFGGQVAVGTSLVTVVAIAEVFAEAIRTATLVSAANQTVIHRCDTATSTSRSTVEPADRFLTPI